MSGPRFSITSYGSGLGGSSVVDPETGWHYSVEILTEDGEEINVNVGHRTYAWAKTLMDAEDGAEPPVLHDWNTMPESMRNAISDNQPPATADEE